jgi:phosphate/phosphite/phosphonate ABC transporter binding protein
MKKPGGEERALEARDFDVPTRIGVGIALTTDPHMTRGLLEQFCLALSDATGLTVEPRGVASYVRLLDQLEAGEIDLVWLPPIPALRATAGGHVVPVALPVRHGESSYSAALFTRADARWRVPADLDGVRAAWVDPQSAAGCLIIRAHLKKTGIDLDRAFSEAEFLGTHDAVADAVVEGRADVGATFAYLDESGRPKRAGWGARSVHLLASAGPIPNDIVAARKGLSSLLVRLVQSALVDVQNAQLREAARVLLAAEGFEVPTPDHLEPLRGLLTGLQEATNQPHSMFPPPGS